MKTAKIIKSCDTSPVTMAELELINQYTRREFSADEVYVFSVVLCDNDIDRDFERFTVESLFALEKLFVGKTGVFDHNPKAQNQTARIFACKVESVDGKKTATGDEYFHLVARAYLPKSGKNKDIILSLDSGIQKEVSVGCAVSKNVCSICGEEINSHLCSHKKGKVYGDIWILINILAALVLRQLLLNIRCKEKLWWMLKIIRCHSLKLIILLSKYLLLCLHIIMFKLILFKKSLQNLLSCIL